MNGKINFFRFLTILLMLKILIVDDDKERSELIYSSLREHPLIFSGSIVVCDNANDCKKQLKIKQYNILILDVVLPNRLGDKPSSLTGLALLDEIARRSTYKKPDRILGITSFVEQYESFFCF